MLLLGYTIALTSSRFLKAIENREDFFFGAKGFFSSIKKKSSRFSLFFMMKMKNTLCNIQRTIFKFPLFPNIKIEG